VVAAAEGAAVNASAPDRDDPPRSHARAPRIESSRNRRGLVVVFARDDEVEPLPPKRNRFVDTAPALESILPRSRNFWKYPTK
jgi:hypothetical protein